MQLTLWYSALLLGVLLLAAGVFFVAFRVLLEVQVDAALHARASQIARSLVDVGGQPELRANGQLYALSHLAALPRLDKTSTLDGGPLTRILNAQGQTLYSSPAFARVALPAASTRQPLAGSAWEDSVHIRAFSFVHVYSVPLRASGQVYGVLQVGQGLDFVTSTVGISAIILLALTPVLLLLSGAGGYWLTSRGLAPIRRLTAAAQRVRAGDLRERVPVPPADDEVRELALTFNEMLAQLEATFTAQRRFIADASHDLRTPVAAMLSLAENARDGVQTDPRAALEDIAAHARRLRQLLTNLLALARADEGQTRQDAEPVRLDTLAEDVVASLQPLAEDRALTLRTGPLDEATVNGDLPQLLLVVMNLVDNALTYTPTGGTVTVSVRREDAAAVLLSVRDTGIGIASSDLPHIFERFYRADAARHRSTGGSGLGLAIVQTLAEAHGGEVTVQSTPGNGSTFTVHLPLASTR